MRENWQFNACLKQKIPKTRGNFNHCSAHTMRQYKLSEARQPNIYKRIQSQRYSQCQLEGMEVTVHSKLNSSNQHDHYTDD
jgi:hypothetical protein